MEENEIIEATMSYVQDALQDSERGHDWFHILRVYRQVNFIAASEPGDKLVIQLAALLHDIADSKFHNGDETIGPKRAEEFMTQLGVANHIIIQVVDIIKNISYSSNLDGTHYKSPELDIVQDADRLDALGAIGIARAFHYGGYKNREIYNPDILPQTGINKDEYKKSTQPTLNHFYEKLLLLKDKMNTATGKRIAEERHAFMLTYLDQFYKEWNEYKEE